METAIDIFKNTVKLVRNQMVETFGRETSTVDNEAVDIIFSNSKNIDKLIERLDSNKNSSIEVIIKGNELSFVEE